MTALIAQEKRSLCCYCGVGCGLRLRARADGGIDLRGDQEHPGNAGALCSKGRNLQHTLRGGEGRILYPQKREGEDWQRQDWDTTMGSISAQLQDIIRRHGPEAVYFYGSGQLLTEDYYTLTKLVKGFLGTNNIDTNSRLCMSSAVVAHIQSLGSDAVPGCYEDFDSCRSLLVAGANPAWSHPIIWKHIVERCERGEQVRVCVVDPRRTDSCAHADLHLALRPGSDVALFHGLARRLWELGGWDEDWLQRHASNVDAYRAAIEPWTLAATAAACDLREKDIATLAEWLLEPRFMSCWTMGLNQSTVGVDKSRALINLHLVSGSIGSPGSGPFSLTGQPNAMGGRETGGMANLLPGHRNLADAQDRAEVAAFWGVESIPQTPGPTTSQLAEAIEAGRIKAVWILATNPAASLPDLDRVRAALASCELVVVQDPFYSDSSELAHWLLPASTWPEKAGTMTSSERRVGLLEAVVPPPGEARDDWRILADLATRLGHGPAFAWKDAAEVFAEWVQLTRGRDCDMSGLSHERLRREGPRQWPVPSPSHPGTARLYTDHRFATADQRAQLHPCSAALDHEPLSAAHPFLLTSGRLRDQWHYQTRSGRVARLGEHESLPRLAMHPDDATSLGLAEADPVRLHNPRGSCQLEITITDRLRPGLLDLPMHWGPRLAGELGAVNRLTSPRYDAFSKQPELKSCAVACTPVPAFAGELVVCGGGAVAAALVDAWPQAQLPQCRLTIIGDEAEGSYDRVQLPHLIDGSRPWEALLRHDPAAMGKRGVRFIHGRASAIDRDGARLILADGQQLTYDHLVLATGSRPRRSIGADCGGDLAGVSGLRTRAQANALAAAAVPGCRAVIIGGGLLGLEVADALARRGATVSVLLRGDRLMGRQLDGRASELLRLELERRGITVLTQVRVERLLGAQRVRALLLADGRELAADLVLEAVGTVANDALARAAGLACAAAGGVMVDQALRSADPRISAAGECAAVAGERSGTTAAARAMVEVLLHQLRGRPHRRFGPWQDANVLKIHGLELAAIGDTDLSGDGVETVLLDDGSAGYYHKRVLRHGRLVGAICLGDLSDFAAISDRVRSGLELDAEERRNLLRPGGGSAALVEGPLVCSCNRIGADTIRRLATDCADSAELCQRSRAGTGCGSCRAQVAEIFTQAQTESLHS